MTLLATAIVPGDGGELRLYEEGEHHSIVLKGGGELMSSRRHGSEDALGRLGCAHLSGHRQVRVLIGGLGLGFTLAAALAGLADEADVVVAELVPEVVAWNRGPLGHHAGDPLRDPRVSVHEVDVAALLKSGCEAFDAVLLDVDNGPAGLTCRGNDWLYSASGLTATFRALRDGGVLAVWSAEFDRAFSERLRRAGFTVETTPARAHGGKGARHLIWLATRQASGTQYKTRGFVRSPHQRR